MQATRWKTILVLLVAIWGIVFALPNVLPKSVRDSMPAWATKTLNLGLDLQGGSYLLYEVDTVALAKERQNALVEDVRTTLTSEDPIAFTQLGIVGDRVLVTIADPAKYDEAYTRIQRLARPVMGGTGADVTVTRQPPQQIVLYRSPEALRAEVSKAVEQNRQSILRRIDALGTREPLVTKQGTNRISIQAAGEADPERLKAIIGQTANLTFQMVDTTVSAAEAAQGIAPPGSEVLPMQEGGAIVVKKRVLVKGDQLTDASSTFDEHNRPAVSFRFNSAGATSFGRATSQNIGKPFAIILDKKVISAPTIQSAITGGNGIITGNFTSQQTLDLALVLRSGALAAPMTIVQQGQVGAELGAQAVQAGKISTVVGFIAIVVFMLLAYGFVFGGISVLGLMLNLILLIAAMSSTQATLTLPGIAGLILTLAVAVDANVLIYERVRDEERSGSRPVIALEHGFKRASVSIYDANVTTLIAAFIMYSFGSGPIKGFAWTLAVGVAAALFSAMLASQVMIGLWFRAKRPKQLPI